MQIRRTSWPTILGTWILAVVASFGASDALAANICKDECQTAYNFCAAPCGMESPQAKPACFHLCQKEYDECVAGCPVVPDPTLPPPPPPILAQPELDFTTPTEWWFMRTASGAALSAKISEGFRLFRLDAVPNSSPVEFTALFVKNTGLYQREGTAFAFDLTLAGATARANDLATRVVDVSSYRGSDGSERYAMVWISNTGLQKRTTQIPLHKASLGEIEAGANAKHLRITDIDFEPVLNIYSAVLVDDPFGERRVVRKTMPDILSQIYESEHAAPPLRRIFLTPLVIEPTEKVDEFIAVLEERNMASEPFMRQWSFTNLEYHGAPPPFGTDIVDPASLDQIDNVGVIFKRLSARYTEYKSYVVTKTDGTSVTKYLAIATENGDYPQEPPGVPRNAATDAIDRAMQETMKTYGIPGGSVAVTQGNRLVYARGYGYSQLSFGPDGSPRNVVPEHLFRLASVSKPITALAVLKLIEKGKTLPGTTVAFGLDTKPFGDVFPLPLGGITEPVLANVTVRQLLQHRTFFPLDIEKAWFDAPNDEERPRAFFDHLFKTKRPTAQVRTGEFSRCPLKMDKPAPVSCYDNLNYDVLTLVIEKVTGEPYEDFVRQEFLEPIGLSRIRITRPRSEGFRPEFCSPHDPPDCIEEPLPEAAGYSNISNGRRCWYDGTAKSPCLPPGGHDGLARYIVQDPRTNDSASGPARNGASGWAAAPVDLLRLWSVADGSIVLPGKDVFHSFGKIAFEAENHGPVGDYLLGLRSWSWPQAVIKNRRLQDLQGYDHNGYFPFTTSSLLALRDEIPFGRANVDDPNFKAGPEDTKFVVVFNGDAVEGPSLKLDLTKAVPSDPDRHIAQVGPGQAIAGGRIHEVLNRYAGQLPNVDLWPTYFPVPIVIGTDCTGLPEWSLGSYSGGAKVQANGEVYQCRPFPFSGWCGQIGYRPGLDLAWEQAWEKLGPCAGGVAEAAPLDCGVLPDWTIKSYSGGDFVQSRGAIYECKGWPFSGWCGQVGYQPGVTLYWQDAWMLSASCISAPPPSTSTIDFRNLDVSEPNRTHNLPPLPP